jgi:hypothetical protein
MANDEAPLFDAATHEQIAVKRYSIQVHYQNVLVQSLSNLPSLFAPKIADSGLPAPPRQPVAVLTALGNYAIEIFEAELAFYPKGDERLPLWLRGTPKSGQ